MSNTNTALAKHDESVHLTKGDVERLINFAVAKVGEKSLVVGNQSNGIMTREELEFYAGMVRNAGLIPKSHNDSQQVLEARAMAKIVAGREFGFDPISSQTLIHFIPPSGTLQVSAEGRASLIKSSGKYDYQIIEHTSDKCVGQFYENISGEWKKLEPAIEFTIDMAKTAGLVKPNSNWEKYPMDMLFARMITRGWKRHCSGLNSGRQDMFKDDELDTDASPKHALTEASPAANAPENEPFFGQSDEPELIRDEQIDEQIEDEPVATKNTVTQVPFNKADSLRFDLITAVKDKFEEFELDDDAREAYLKGRAITQLKNEELSSLIEELA